MLNNKTIAVVVPAYNEEKQIGMVIETMPDFVDRIIVVNDCSTDKTADIVKQYIEKDKKKTIKIENILHKVQPEKYNYSEIVLQKQLNKELSYFPDSNIYKNNTKDKRIVLINELKNSGVGAAIARGYKWCKDYNIDCIAVMAGDGQMDSDELKSICRPVVEDDIDYVKGNRLIHRSSLLVIPKIRYSGNSVLSVLTKVASGYWHVSDTQTGYTAISNKALNSIRIHKIYKKYGMPNDMLVKLNIAFCSIKEVEIKPIYNIGENSKMKICKVIFPILWLLFKSFFKRLWIKYLFRDFHPLFLLYNFAFLLAIIDIPVLIKIIRYLCLGQSVTFQSLIVFIFLFISGFQSLFFAMWMDIQDNERLYKS